MMAHHQRPGIAGDEIRDSQNDLTSPATSMTRVAAASVIGTLIEYYDFGIYGFAAALVFGKVFFPAFGTAAATVAAFATFGVAFMMRPVGAILFGHFGDRLGRKKTLILSLFMMGMSTTIVGLLPTTSQIGIIAPIALMLLRVIQGLAAGGEWAGAVLFAAENAPGRKRGFWSMFASLGAGIALALAPATFLLSGVFISNESFMTWGWRLPFLSSFFLLVVGFWIRFSMDETPVFKTAAESGKLAQVPVIEAIRKQFKEIVLAGGAMLVVFSFGYLGVAFLTSYGVTTMHLSRTYVLAISIASGLVYTFGILMTGLISDTTGRRKVVVAAALIGLIWSFVLFPLLGLGSDFVFAIGVLVTMLIAGASLGPMSAFLSELFDTRYRYTAVGVSYNIAGVVGGAVVPIVGASITATYGGQAFGYLLAFLSLMSLICVMCLRETKGEHLNGVGGEG